jgi:hypothetical protein|tara:strand:+ start:1086 stop:1229 length:144 start_codon:yes stop_codon:yes gene_type:complete
MENLSVNDLLTYLNNKIETQQYIDSVHKIKILTTVEIIEKTLVELDY